MIRVIKDWVIDADANGYIVGRLTISKKGKEGITGRKYPSTLTNAIKSILEYEKRDLIMRNNMSLTEAVEKVNNLHLEFEELLEKVLKEKL